MNNDQTTKRPSTAQPNTHSRLVVVGIIVGILTLALLIWVFACNGFKDMDPNVQNGQAPYKSEERKQAEEERQIEEGMFNISIASTIRFEDGAMSGKAYIENVPGNQYDMKVVITGDSSGEVLYESGVLAPEQFIEDITLARDLDAGTYNATATFTALDQITGEDKGQVEAKIAINVLA